MAKYKLQSNGVLDTERNLSIPDTVDNRHWVRYQEWLAEGNTPDPQFTQEELDAQYQNDLQTQRLRTLKQATVDQFELIIALFQMGRAKGLWTAADFPEPLRAKVQEWQQLIDDLKNSGLPYSGIAITGQQEFIT